MLDLVAVLAAGRAAAAATAHRAAAHCHIEEHLTDPGLGAEQVAAAVGISERQLSRVFAADGTSVPRHILTRRLQLAYSVLAAPPAPGEAAGTVADVAARCGFTSATYFSHAFRAALRAARERPAPLSFSFPPSGAGAGRRDRGGHNRRQHGAHTTCAQHVLRHGPHGRHGPNTGLQHGPNDGWERKVPAPCLPSTTDSPRRKSRPDAAVETDVLIVGSGPAGGAAALQPGHARRAEHHDHEVPLDGQHAARAHHQPAGDGDLPRLRHRGPGARRRDAARTGRRHRVLHVDRRRGDRPHPHLGHAPRPRGRLPAGVSPA